MLIDIFNLLENNLSGSNGCQSQSNFNARRNDCAVKLS